MKIILAFSLLCSFANADWKQFYFEKSLQKGKRVETKLTPQTFTQKLDHFNSNERTFRQRYYIDSSLAASKDSPVLFYLCGEAVCTERSLNGAIRNHARELKAHLISLEHRYYGESHPFEQLTTANLRYLSTSQALADAAHFQQSIQKNLGLNGKWVAIGGSYPGSLAAYYRSRYPKLAVGALSSSGPVIAQENFEEYDHHVWKVAGSDCAGQIQKVVAQVEAALNNSEELLRIKKLFVATQLTNNDDFLYLIADMAALAVQYGYRDHFCDLLNQGDPMEGYAKFTREIYDQWEINALSGSIQGALSEDPKDYPDLGMRQWYYQSCTEYGYWQTAYHEAKESARSSRIDLKYHHDACVRMFGLSSPAETHNTNQLFFEPLLNKKTTQIYFTNGSQDPWSNLSILKAPESNPALSTFIIEGAAHCDDLRAPKLTDSAVLKKSRQVFLELAREWLK